MHKEGYYSSGEFAKKANVTVRTIRYYDKQNILKPSYVTDTGVRFYTDSDFTRLQQILLLKYLGFSLDDIKGMTIGDSDYNILKNSLHLQLKLIQDKMAQMQLVKNAIEDTIKTIDKDNTIDWSSMLSLIHLTNMESSLKTQYQNAGNISARINLHAMYSVNKQGWFKWIYEQGNIASHTEVLELGCGDGRLWVDNIDSVISQNIKPHITVSDISEGMVNDARRNITEAYEKCVKNHKNMVSSNNIFEYDVADCQNMSYNDASYDCVIANHVLFYCEDIDKACQEIVRVLKPGGVFVCATYGSRHMQEISQLVKEFDKRIVLAVDNLYDKFGLDTGDKQLNKYFTSVNIRRYDDCLKVDKAEPLVEYILSCHGNQNQYLLDRYSDFKSFIQKKLRKTLTITKDAGLFYCVKE